MWLGSVISICIWVFAGAAAGFYASAEIAVSSHAESGVMYLFRRAGGRRVLVGFCPGSDGIQAIDALPYCQLLFTGVKQPLIHLGLGASAAFADGISQAA